MHNAFLNINNKKMSKSLGNFFTVREISEKYDLQVLRFFMLTAHYRNPLNFSAELMESAKAGLDRILTGAERLKDLIEQADETDLSSAEMAGLQESEKFTNQFEKAMDDDFNTADAITAIFDFVKFLNTNTDENSSKAYLTGLHDSLWRLADVLGLILDREEENLDDEIEELIQERQDARKNKDFAKADEIRDKLLAMGIVLEDTREGVKWKRA